MGKIVRIATSCKDGGCCPVADLDEESQLVTIHDPEAPLRGSFVMTKEEWDRLASSIEK